MAMKKRCLSILALSTLSSLAWADIDVSDLYLQNAGFDEESHFDYRISEEGNVAQEILPIYGWNKDFSVDYTVCGIYEFGTSKTFNTYGKVPSAGYDNSKGGCLALSTGWDQEMKFYQTVTLPAGDYKLQTAYFNGSNSNNGYSLLGWIPENGNAKISSMSSFPSDQWKIDEVSFSLSKETTGRIQIGFKAVSNGSANSAKVVADFVKLYVVGEGSTGYLAEELSKRVDAANELLTKTMNATHRKNLKEAVENAQSWISSPSTQNLSSIVSDLRKATESAQSSVDLYSELADLISEAEPAASEDAEIADALNKAKKVYADENKSVADVNEMILKMDELMLFYRTSHASGPVPTVTTDPRHARGATMAFGRASFSGSGIVEKGFCYGTRNNPTIRDSRSTKSFSNNGNIYVIEGMTPSTFYYIRPYAITNQDVVGYGKTIKICTLPMGEITWTYNNGGSAEENGRINSAVKDAVDIWNNLTSIKGINMTVNYGASTQTADCSYGGWMRVGPNASYQRTGTIQHEMAHAVGVGTTDTWYNSSIYRENTSTGFWLGERTDQILAFLENDNNAHLKGDKTHFWPYGINGAHEDDGTRMLYYANALIVQALGEDNLPPVSGAFASPAYTFIQDDNEYYYILSADDVNSMLKSNGEALQIAKNDWKTVLKDNSYAWIVKFNPSTQYYEFKNVESEKDLSFNRSSVQLSSNDNFGIQMLGSRQNVVTNDFNLKSYWLTFENGTNKPNSLTSSYNGVTASVFDHQNSASKQRWVILSRQEVKALAGDLSETENYDADNSSLIVYSVNEGIAVESTDKGEWIHIYDISGRIVKKFYMQAGMKVCVPVNRGVYIVNGKMVMVK
ncbi:MAG: DUF5013 domain-containing protein [Bacteroidales bacterium]|jgi:hypothetical protein|nr:DUF5013 domain-containing protein [Bacteroidales bacterium]